MKKLFGMFAFTVILAMLLAVNAGAYRELQNGYYDAPDVFYRDGVDAGVYVQEYEIGGDWFWDDATASSNIQASFSLALDQMTAYSYSYIKNDYDGNTDSETNSEIHRTGRVCETSASINDVYATYFKLVSRMTVDGTTLFNVTKIGQ